MNEALPSIRDEEVFVKIKYQVEDYGGLIGMVIDVRPTGILDVAFNVGDVIKDATVTSIFRPSELEIIELSPAEKASYFFGKKGWTMVNCLKEPFKENHPCSVRDCPNMRSRRIYVNIWSSVYEFDVCPSCAVAWHRKRCDSFPVRDECESRFKLVRVRN